MRFLTIAVLLMVFILVDFMVFNQGINSAFWQYKTPVELEFQKQILEERKAKNTPQCNVESNTQQRMER